MDNRDVADGDERAVFLSEQWDGLDRLSTFVDAKGTQGNVASRVLDGAPGDLGHPVADGLSYRG